MGKIYDIAVIGGGPGGYTAAIRAAQLGAKVVVFEKQNLGGVCLNVGCIPTKCLLEKAALIDKIRKNSEKGIFKEAGLFSWKKIQENKDQTVKRLTGGIGSILKSYGIDVVSGEAVLTEAGKIVVGGHIYRAGKTIIATGSKVMIPPIKGADGSRVLTSTEALSLKQIPDRLVIIGGGVIGLEFASIYNTVGTEVTVIEMLEDIAHGEDREMIAILKKELLQRGIVIYTGASIEAIGENNGKKCVTYRCGTEKKVCEADYVLMAAGRKANTGGIELAGLATDRSGYIVVNQKMETNIPDVYAVGDITGGMQLAHTAYAEAEAAAENAVGRTVEADLSVVPRCIYSIPQLAAVGATEEQLVREGVEYRKALYPYATNGKALAADEPAGMVKVLARSEDDRILGVHIVGGYATELLSGAVVAVNQTMTISQFETMIFPHPTMSEMLKEAMLAVQKKAVHLPK